MKKPKYNPPYDVTKLDEQTRAFYKEYWLLFNEYFEPNKPSELNKPISRKELEQAIQEEADEIDTEGKKKKG